MTIFTQADSDNLADILWWLKGYIAASEDKHEACDFGIQHIDSLRCARVLLDDENREKKTT